MQKQQSVGLKKLELTYILSICEHLESTQEMLLRLFSTHSFTEQETLNLVQFLVEERRRVEIPELVFWLESMVLWSLPTELSRYSEGVGISLVWTDGNSTLEASTLL